MSEPATILDYYGTELRVEVVGASPGVMVDLERRFSSAKPPENRTDPTDFDRLSPPDAIGLAVELLNAAQQADPHGAADAYLRKFEEMSREGRF